MRYIGTKTKLLEFLENEILKFSKLEDGAIFCDAFSGTCGVGDYFQDRFKIIANDNLYFAYLLARAKLCSKNCKFDRLDIEPFSFFNNCKTDDYTVGYCYNNFAPKVSGRQYFSDENAKLIDFIRDTVEIWYAEKKITIDEHDYLLGCLIESLSKVSNVAGVYAAYLHIWDIRATKRMKFIRVENVNEPRYENEVFNQNSNELIPFLNGTFLYLDPPYTSTQYISQYHVLETIARNDNPIHHGIGAHRDNGEQISSWSKKYKVELEFYNIVANAKFNYIGLSYSDAGIMERKYIEAVLKRFSKPQRFKFVKCDFVKYKNSRALTREINEKTKDKKHYEWLFLSEKTAQPRFISPLNYIGGKYELLDFLKERFPKKIGAFYDLFGGGGTVNINVEAEKIIYNDINFIVTDLLEYIALNDPSEMYRYIDKAIKKYKLEKGNKENYVLFRELYNSKPIKQRHPLDLYILICFGFEHQIRFNSNLDFNNPCGNSGFNAEMLEKLISYSCEAKRKEIKYYSYDYRFFEKEITSNDFVYCDPPYLMTCGAYNDGKRGFNGWNEANQKELLDFLDRLNARNVKFALSNILERGEEKNEVLIKWIEENNYIIHKNEKLTRRNRQNRTEILITNY